MHDKVVGGVQKGSCACMYNWTDVVSVLITAGQVKYLFLSVQQLPVIAQALYGSKVALLCLLWDFCEILMEFPCYFYDLSMRFLSDSYGISMLFLFFL